MSRFSASRPGTWGAPPPPEPRPPQWHKDRQRRAEEVRTLLRAGFVRYGDHRHDWWRMASSGMVPSMSRGEALQRARVILFRAAAHAQLTKK